MYNILSESEMVVNNDTIQEIITDVASDLNCFGRLTIIPILNASFMFTTDLVRKINIPIEIEFMKISSYIGGVSSKQVEVCLQPIHDKLKGKDVLIVDTIMDSGNTMRTAIDIVNVAEPNSVNTCVLVRKTNEKNLDFNINLSHIDSVEGFLFGYGTDYKDGTCRNLSNMYRKRE